MAARPELSDAGGTATTLVTIQCGHRCGPPSAPPKRVASTCRASCAAWAIVSAGSLLTGSRTLHVAVTIAAGDHAPSSRLADPVGEPADSVRLA